MSDNLNQDNFPIPDLDFADLQNNFDKRTYHFNRYQQKLGQSNPRLLISFHRAIAPN
jgi:hypothetical protein